MPKCDILVNSNNVYCSIYGSSPLGGFQSVPLGRASRVSEGPNAWVIFPKGSTVSEVDHSNFTMRPINFSQSIGSRLKQSFAQINNSTPVESISGEPLIDEKPQNKSKVRRNAIIAGISVATGATLLAVLLIGGAILFSTSGTKEFRVFLFLNFLIFFVCEIF